MSPNVSVIIPNYNHAAYLSQRISSVLNQTYQDFEVIILDDCSTDNSRTIIETFRGHEKVTNIVYNEINSGTTFKQWKKGIELAESEYIWIAESDDWCEPTLLTELMTGLINNNDCVVSFCQSLMTNGLRIMYISQFDNLCEYFNGQEFVNQHMVKRNTIFNASMAVWKKTAFNNISNNYTEFKFCGDWLFWLEMCLQGDVYVSGKVLNYFRKHDADVSGRFYVSGKNFLEEIKVFDVLLGMNLISEDVYAKALREQYWRFSRIEDGFDRDVSKHIKSEFFKNIKYNKFIKYNESSVINKIIRKGFSFFKNVK